MNMKNKKKKKTKKKIMITNITKNYSKTEKEERDVNLKEKEIADSKQREPPLKSIVVYLGTNQGDEIKQSMSK